MSRHFFEESCSPAKHKTQRASIRKRILRTCSLNQWLSYEIATYYTGTPPTPVKTPKPNGVCSRRRGCSRQWLNRTLPSLSQMKGLLPFRPYFIVKTHKNTCELCASTKSKMCKNIPQTAKLELRRDDSENVAYATTPFDASVVFRTITYFFLLCHGLLRFAQGNNFPPFSLYRVLGTFCSRAHRTDKILTNAFRECLLGIVTIRSVWLTRLTSNIGQTPYGP